MVRLNEARECLLDPEKRRLHDAQLRGESDPATTGEDAPFAIETLDEMSYEEALAFFLTVLSDLGDVRAEYGHPNGYDILVCEADTGHLIAIRLCIWPSNRAVGSTAVAQCVTGAMADDADRAWVITNRTFSPEAVRVSQKVAFDTLLIDRRALSDVFGGTDMNRASEQSANAAREESQRGEHWYDRSLHGLPDLDREGR